MKRLSLVVLVMASLAISAHCMAEVSATERAARDALTRARLALKQKDKAAAKSLFEKVFTDYPDTRQAPAALLSHAYLVLADNKPLAEEEFRAAATRYPDSPEAARAWLRVAYLRLDAKEPDAAAYFKLVADQYPGSVAAQEALFRLGRLSIRNKELDEAQATFENAESAPGSDRTKAQALVHLGDVHVSRFLATKNQPELDKAREILLHIEDKYPKETRSIMQGRVDMARLYSFVGNGVGVHDPALARQILVEAQRKWPDTYFTMEAHTLVGLTYYQQNDYKGAVDYFERMVLDYPKSEWNSMLLHLIGNMHQKLGDTAKAIEAHNRCVQFNAKTDWAKSSQRTLASLTSGDSPAK